MQQVQLTGEYCSEQIPHLSLSKQYDPGRFLNLQSNRLIITHQPKRVTSRNTKGTQSPHHSEAVENEVKRSKWSHASGEPRVLGRIIPSGVSLESPNSR